MQALAIAGKELNVYEQLLGKAWDALSRAERWSKESIDDAINIEMGNARGISSASYVIYEFSSEIGQVKALVEHLKSSKDSPDRIKRDAEELWVLATSIIEGFMSVASISDIYEQEERRESFARITRSVLSFENVQSMRKPEFKVFVADAGKNLAALSEYIGTGDSAPNSLKEALQGLVTTGEAVDSYLEVF